MENNTIDELMIVVSAESDEAVQNLNNTADALRNLKEAAKGGTRGLTKVINTMKEVNTSTNTTKRSFWDFIKGLKKTSAEGKKTESSLSKLGARIKSIIQRRLIMMAIRAVINAITEGINNAYQWSKAMGGTFAESMDRLSTSALYLKNSIGAALIPILNTLTPVIEFLVDVFVGLLNVVNQFISAISGASTWTKALKYQTEYAEAAESSAKAVQKTLLGFDAINRLNDNSSSGSSSNNYGMMFQEVALKNTGVIGLLSKISKKIISFFKNLTANVENLKIFFGDITFENLGEKAKEVWIKFKKDILSNIFNTAGTALEMTGNRFILEIPLKLLFKIASSETSGTDKVSSKISSVITTAVQKGLSDAVKATKNIGFDFTSAGITLKLKGITTKADGGFVNEGTLFYAGEKGAEVVTNVGGKTNVLNTEQMSAALQNANIGVVSAIYKMADAVVSAVNSKNMTVNLDGNSIGKSVDRYNSSKNVRYGF